MNKTVENKIRNASIEELDKWIDSLPRTFMKAILYQQIKSVRPDYVPKHKRKKLVI